MTKGNAMTERSPNVNGWWMQSGCAAVILTGLGVWGGYIGVRTGVGIGLVTLGGNLANLRTALGDWKATR